MTLINGKHSFHVYLAMPPAGCPPTPGIEYLTEKDAEKAAADLNAKIDRALIDVLLRDGIVVYG